MVPYEFERLVPFIGNGPLIWWLYPVFGHAAPATSWACRNGRLASCCSRASEASGLAFLGALGSTGTFVATVTIIPYAGGLGYCGRLSGDDRHCTFPDEGRRLARTLLLSVETGSGSTGMSIAVTPTLIHHRRACWLAGDAPKLVSKSPLPACSAEDQCSSNPYFGMRYCIIIARL